MKIRLLFLLFLFIATSAVAQQQLNKSPQSGYFTYIYQLTDQEMLHVSLNGKSVINDHFLHTKIDSFYKAPYQKKLPFGNYLLVSAIRNQLSYRLHAERNVDLEFVNSLRDFQFYVKDLKGDLVENAKVEIDKGKKVVYDVKGKVYYANYQKKESGIIKVSYNGVSSFFEYENDHWDNDKEDWGIFKKIAYATPIIYTWQPFKKIFSKKYGKRVVPNKKPYKGYMVFSKPKYKPLDTVKFKAYLVDVNGRDIKNKTLDVILTNNEAKGKKIASIKSYRNGGYTHSFVLADSLNLKLDRYYSIQLAEEDKPIISESFKYEDYELNSLSFEVRVDRKEHKIGAPISVYMKATDENELAVADGRVEVVALSRVISSYHDKNVFVPDTLWRKEMNLEPIGETKLIIPDVIFPKASLNFDLKFYFKNSNNETRTENKYLSYSYQNKGKFKEIRPSLKKDSLFIAYLENDKIVNQLATVVSYSSNQVLIDSITTPLPVSIKTDFRAEYYAVKTNDGFSDKVYLSDFEPKLNIGALQDKDSLKVVVDNEYKVPFWYTIFSGNRILLKGYTTHLDTVIKHGISKAAHVRINYYWDEEEKTAEVSAIYNPNLLNVKLIAPDMVYPGQRVNMLVKITDVANNPVPETDLTAYAFTSKFGNISTVNMPNFAKSYKVRKKNYEVEADEVYFNGNMQMNWEKWGKALGLDTIAYYKFIHPNGIYTFVEERRDSLAQIAPFVIDKGNIDPVHLIYIDGIPVYFSQVDQLQRYAIIVKPGLHDIKLRTASKMVELANFDVPKNAKTILSIDADVTNLLAKVSHQPNVLKAEEANNLTQYMLKVVANFSGEKTIIKADTTAILLNPPPAVIKNKDLLIGPLKENILSFEAKGFTHHFIKESGYTYTFLPNLIKQKSYADKYGFNLLLKPQPANGNDNYKQYALKSGEIDSIWNDYLDLRSYSTPLFNNNTNYYKDNGRLEFEIDSSFKNKYPYIKNVIIYKPEEPSFLQLYNGQQNEFSNLEATSYRIMFLLKDNRYFTANDVIVKKGGSNYYKWDSFKVSAADQFSKDLDVYIKSVQQNGSARVDEKVITKFNEQNFDKALLSHIMTGRVVAKDDQLSIAGAIIKVVGLNALTQADVNGYFTLHVPAKGKVMVTAIGYEGVELDVKNGNVGSIILKESSMQLQEVVVIGYGSIDKRAMLSTTSINAVSNSLVGKLAGVSVGPGASDMIRLRGVADMEINQKPLIIVDGVVFNGDVNQLNKDDILDLSMLKDAAATAIYGARAANGVVIIKTNKGKMTTNIAGELVRQEQTMRTNFADEGFWRPSLITNKEGYASFEVKFPDDITNWKTRIYAINGKKQIGFAESAIKSFKSLSANFVSPQFAIFGDHMNVIGKLMNYTATTESVTRQFLYNGKELKNGTIAVKNAHIDTLAITINSKDSLRFQYTLNQSNGYFDGEIRKIPVFEAGVQETKGYFSALLKDTTINYSFDKQLGKITVRAEASIFPTLLDEMTKLSNYEYLCNEQMASKLKSLLLEKQTRAYLNEKFNHEKDITVILKKLIQNKKTQGTWGWWQNSEEQLWISLHVMEALIMAEKQGYKIEIDRKALANYLIKKIIANSDDSKLHALKLLNLVDGKYYIKDLVMATELQKPAQKISLYERLQLMQLKQLAGIKVNIDSLLAIKKHTMFGSIYWGEEHMRFFDNSIQNTLLAYQILKANGNVSDLEKIQYYFLEQRKGGQWRNTYESSLILETILPELVQYHKKSTPASIKINQQVVSQFPFDTTIESPVDLKVEKMGADIPVYFTAYQQFQNAKPLKVAKDFKVSTNVLQNGNVVAQLKAGTLAKLKVEVEVRADADYVMIEVPIPAGCSYENKLQNFWGIETHREYFKNKTSIFCTKLKKGKYTFEIDLMPRYVGNYILNPAKVEMMYFPVFYGREGMQKVEIN